MYVCVCVCVCVCLCVCVCVLVGGNVDIYICLHGLSVVTVCSLVLCADPESLDKTLVQLAICSVPCLYIQ